METPIEQIHQKLQKLVKKEAARFQDAGLRKYFEQDLQWHELFENYRANEKSAYGLKLNIKGLRLFSLIWKSFEIPTPESFDQMPIVLLWLDRTQQLPYYLDKKKIVLFDDDFAVFLKLNDGNLVRLARQWLDSTAKAVSKYSTNGQ